MSSSHHHHVNLFTSSYHRIHYVSDSTNFLVRTAGKIIVPNIDVRIPKVILVDVNDGIVVVRNTMVKIL